MVNTMAEQEAKREIRKQVFLISLEEFAAAKGQASNFSSEPVNPSSMTDAVRAPASDQKMPEIPEAPNVTPGNSPAAPESHPAMPQPIMIELASEPPHEAMNGSGGGDAIA